MSITDQYIWSALDHYPFNLEMAAQSIAYALAYDESNIVALCLEGRMHAEQLQDYEKAKELYAQAIGHHLEAHIIYPHYVQACIWNEDFEEAKKLLAFALSMKGSKKIELLFLKVILHEKRLEFAEAKSTLKELKLIATSEEDFNKIESIKKRILSKMQLMKRSK